MHEHKWASPARLERFGACLHVGSAVAHHLVHLSELVVLPRNPHRLWVRVMQLYVLLNFALIYQSISGFFHRTVFHGIVRFFAADAKPLGTESHRSSWTDLGLVRWGVPLRIVIVLTR